MDDSHGANPGAKPSEEQGEIASAYYANHDLRSVYTRENVNRRRSGGHTLRKYLTDKQDRQILSSFIKIRHEYDVANNNEVVIVWAQQQIEAGKKDELADELVALAETVEVRKRPGGEFVAEN